MSEITNLVSVVAETIAAGATVVSIGREYLLSRRYEKFSCELEPVLSYLEIAAERGIEPVAVQQVVTVLVPIISIGHFGRPEPPPRECKSCPPPGTHVACRICKVLNIPIRPNGGCPNCALPAMFWMAQDAYQGTQSETPVIMLSQ